MSSAKELLHHLHLLEKGQVRSDIHKVTATSGCSAVTDRMLLDIFKVDKDEQKGAGPPAPVGSLRPCQGAGDANGTGQGSVEEAAKQKAARRAERMSPRVNDKEEDGGDVTCLTCMGTGALPPLEGARVPQPPK